MVTQKIVDMTIDDIKSLIVEVVDEKLRSGRKSKDARSVEQVLAAMDCWRWTPPLNSPSTSELLREDRDI